MKWCIERYGVVESTMNIAAARPVGSVVVADEQTAGIGRHGNEWDSPAGAGLYVSLVLNPRAVLTLALGLAAQQAIRDVTALRCDLRWPNDLMLGDRKIGGILVQLVDGKAVAGLGINITQRRFAPELKEIATSLLIETGLEFRRDDLLEAVLSTISRELSRSTEDVLAKWEQASSWAWGKRVRVDMGNAELLGLTSGLDSQGFLRVRREDGVVETVYAGGVRSR